MSKPKSTKRILIPVRNRAIDEVQKQKDAAKLKSVMDPLPPENTLHALQQAAVALIRRAEEMAAYPLSEVITDIDGNEVAIKPAKWSSSDIAKNYKAAADLYEKIAQLAEHLPTDPHATKRWKMDYTINRHSLQAKERPFAAVQLRLMGWSYREIAEKLGYGDQSGAYQAINGLIMQTIQPATDALRALEVERLDMMLEQAYDTAIGANGKVSLEGLDRVIAIEKLRIRLLGLEAPRQVDVHAVIDRVAEAHGYDEEEKREATQFVQDYLRRKRLEQASL